MKLLYYCIPQAVCGLCSFDLSDGELACAVVGEDGVCSEFPFRRFSTFVDEKLRVKVHMCLRAYCMRREKLTAGFHKGCYRYKLAVVTPKVLDINRHTFIPAANEMQQRFHYTEEALASNINQVSFWPQKLPNELWLNIAGFLVRECVIHTTQAQALSCDKDVNVAVDLAQPVYASFIKIHGRFYVKRLQNKADANVGEVTCLILPAQTQQDRKKVDMLIAQDHLGIRQVFFLPSKRCEEWCSSHTGASGLWWKHVSDDDMPSTVVFKSDGLKLRDVTDIPSDTTESKTRVGWQVPVSSTPTVHHLLSLGVPESNRPGLRMRAFDCNSPDIVGYAVATDGAKILAVLSHRRGEKLDTSLHENVDSHFFWMYMPVDPDEHLTDICIRTVVFLYQPQVIGMTFSTSKGRTVVFGQYRHENTNLRRLVKAPPKPYRLYFNEVDPLANADTIKWVAFESDDLDSIPPPQDALPDLPCSISVRPNRLENDLWVYSSCLLTGIAEIHLCIDETASHQPVIGMLVYYGDDHRECVGQIRLDWLTRRLLLHPKDKLYISGGKTEKDWAFVSDVATREPEGQEKCSWIEVDLTKTLEWWFSSWHNVLDYDGHRLS